MMNRSQAIEAAFTLEERLRLKQALLDHAENQTAAFAAVEAAHNYTPDDFGLPEIAALLALLEATLSAPSQ